jgi:hypothetical protein
VLLHTSFSSIWEILRDFTPTAALVSQLLQSVLLAWRPGRVGSTFLNDRAWHLIILWLVLLLLLRCLHLSVLVLMLLLLLLLGLLLLLVAGVHIGVHVARRTHQTSLVRVATQIVAWRPLQHRIAAKL